MKHKYLLITFLIAYTKLNAQNYYSLEYGFRLINGTHFIETNFMSTSSFRSVLESKVINNNGSLFLNMHGAYDYYKIKELKTTGLALPQFYFQNKIKGRLWLRNNLEFFSFKVYSTESFDYRKGTEGTLYNNYLSKQSGLQHQLNFQFRWLQKSKIYIQSGFASSWQISKQIQTINGCTIDCFGGSSINSNLNRTKFSAIFPRITNTLVFPLTQKVNLTYENSFDIVSSYYPIFRHQISLGKALP